MLFLPANNNSLYGLTSIAYIALCLFCSTARGQIVPDATLPNNTVVSPSGNTLEITGGTTTGNNLFHSFSQFSLPTGDTAWFNNATNIDNIIGRVTGDSISTIDGSIKVNSSANLFLINPNGIIFGENAALDIGGSFLGSTANSIQFADGNEFSAVNPDAPPLLTINMPVGLQFGENNGDITVKGNGHNAWFDFDTFTVDRLDRNSGLEVAPGNTIGFIGNNVSLEGGNLTAEAGNIELGAVVDGKVELIANKLGWTFNYGEINRGNISLSNSASVDVSGNGSGNIQIYGDEVNLIEGSAIFAETEGNIAGGLIAIDAKRVNIIGTDRDLFLPSSIWSDVYLDATGDGGSVEIEADRLFLEGGGSVNVNTFSLGDAGNLTVRAKEIELVGESDGGDFFSALSAQADIFLTGKGGDISVKTDNLLVSDGAQISTTTFGEGDAGNLTIDAQNIELDGTSEFGSSGLFAATEGEGDGGNLTVETDFLQVNNGAQVGTTTFGEGDGGILDITANKIELDGTSEFGSSGLFAATDGEGDGGNLTVESDFLQVNNGAQISTTAFFLGNGGNLTIETDFLQVNNGAQIATNISGSGNAGTLTITAKDIDLSGGSELGASGIFGTALVDMGNGGNLNIGTDKLSIKNGATISASNFFSRGNGEPGLGKAGNINIEANSLELDNTTSEFASSITASTNNSGGGNIQLDITDNLILNNNSEITADTRGDGDGGNIAIASNNLQINNQARISVNSIGNGNAGNIDLTVNDLDSNFGKITATSQNSGGGDIKIAADFIDLQNNSEISTSVLNGTGGGGNITIDSNYILGRNNSDIRANAVEGDGGNINITTDVMLFDFNSEIDASSEFGLDGVIEIDNLNSDKQIGVVSLPQKIVDPTALITAVCPVKDGESLVTTGKGGLAENPSQSIRGESVWEDLRDVADVSKSSNDIEVIEAKAWNINQQGKVELLSYVPQSAKGDYWTSFNQCR